VKEASDHFHIAALSGKERVHIYVNTTIFATHADPKTASRNLQEHLFTIQNWLQKWKIKVNETKSSHITFTLRKDNCPAVSINQTVLPQVESVKYFRTTLRPQTELESTHYQETETNWPKSKRNQLANKEKIQPVYRRQNTSLQSGDQTHLDLRNRTLGMCQQVQQSNYAESTIKNSQNHNKCSLVCDKPYPPYRP